MNKKIKIVVVFLVMVVLTAVLSSIFRKFVILKNEIVRRNSGEGAAKPRLFATLHIAAAVSRAA